MRHIFYKTYIKRAMDLILALLIALPVGVIIAICCICIKLESKGPAFFIQKRPGKNGVIFSMYKLRSMIMETERDGRYLSDMERMTKVGRFMRSCSLDELPQIWNIVKGDMSFIGPRPLMPGYLPLYSAEQMRRHEVLPGISGWAQVNGRNEISWEQKFERDVWYVDHICAALDLKICGMTIENVISGKGVNAGVNETMSPFTGVQQ